MKQTKYDVFISCKSEDYDFGRVVYNFLSMKGVIAFMADEKLRGLGISDYGRAIDDALDNSRHFVLVTSAAENVMPEFSPYVYYEWHTFSEEKKSGRKSGNIMTIVTEMGIVTKLPIALRNHQAFSLDNYQGVLSYLVEKYDEKVDALSKLGLSMDNSCNEIDKSYERKWHVFINAIIRRKIIPVIGGDFLRIGDKTINQYVLEDIIKRYDIDINRVKSYSDLDSFLRFDSHDIHCILSHYWHKNVDRLAEMVEPELIYNLLSLPFFPFVATINTDPIVEHIMNQIHGKLLNIYEDVRNNYTNLYRIEELSRPTLVYMFGKGGFQHSYVLDSNEYHFYVKLWMSDNNYRSIREIKRLLQSHYLLFLGYDYKGGIDDFLWEDLKMPDSRYVRTRDDYYRERLYEFIQDIENGLKLCPELLLSVITKRIEIELKEEEKGKFKAPMEDADIYISCSYADMNIAEKLNKSLTALGRRVWYDKTRLGNDSSIKQKIMSSIKSASVFVPILSNNTIKEKDESQLIRAEWDVAIDSLCSYGPKVVIPLVEKGFDFSIGIIPDEMKKLKRLQYSKDDDYEELAKKLLDLMYN